MTTHLKKYMPDGISITSEGDLSMCEVKSQDIVSLCESLYRVHKLPLKTITVFDERATSGFFKIMYVFGLPAEHAFLAPYILVKDSFPSLTPSIHEASVYERKIKSFFGLEPIGHPKPRSLILHDENWPAGNFPLRKDFNVKTKLPISGADFPFDKIEGEGVYEIPVGPVHAGIIEPGHFRFSVAGEEILLLEPRLGYSHKGSEKLFENLPLADNIRLSERISGDSSFNHSLAFCQALEKLSGTVVPPRARYLRVIFAELERIANHFGDIGAIMVDTGFNFGGSQGARLRELVMRLNEQLTGSRFLRGVTAIGGVTKDISSEMIASLTAELDRIEKDFNEVIAVAEGSSSLQNRLKDTGVLPRQVAEDHGVTGIAGRALGFARDTRIDYPYAAYAELPVTIALEEAGDVYARFYVRIKEVSASFTLLTQALADIPQGKIMGDKKPLLKNKYAVSVVEGWRGDIVYVVATNATGEIDRVDVRDPSLLNWTALGYAGKGNMVPDFPLINKSFNLSYSGNDV